MDLAALKPRPSESPVNYGGMSFSSAFMLSDSEVETCSGPLIGGERVELSFPVYQTGVIKPIYEPPVKFLQVKGLEPSIPGFVGRCPIR